ncbi:hypothetical protein ACA910_003043 [Epithemia clementina (nom. ined.)]
MASYTAVQIPCCLCGTMIWPNAANKCSACLASQLDVASIVQRGPGGGDIVVYQCRQCRRYQRFDGSNNKNASYQAMEPESPELLALCLKHIPAVSTSSSSSNNHQFSASFSSTLSSSSSSMPKFHIVDAHWIWTEPHSMRFKVHLTVRYSIEQVPVQQRVSVELKNQWKQCPDCNREFTNRTWHAVVQLRQTPPAACSNNSNNNNSNNSNGGSGSKRGLAALEMAIAQQATIRKHVLKIDATKNGFDFYFLDLAQAQAFGSYLQRLHPMRAMKSSSKLVSTDVKNNTANLRHTLQCDLVPLCRDDLVLVNKRVMGGAQKLAGRLALVDKVSSVLTLLDASPSVVAVHAGSSSSATPTTTLLLKDCIMELSAENYYRNEKHIRWLQSSDRLTRFVVLDVELLQTTIRGKESGIAPEEGGVPSSSSSSLYQGPQSGLSKYALAEVVVVRESDFGTDPNAETITVVTHLGHLLQAGDIALGYDLARTVGGDWELDSRSLHNHFVVPDVVLVKKETNKKKNKNSVDDDDNDNNNRQDLVSNKKKKKGSKHMTKKREKRKLRKEGKKMRALEESAARMGFIEGGGAANVLPTPDEEDDDDEEEGDDDDDAASKQDNNKNNNRDFEDELWNDPEMAEELKQLEQALEAAAVGPSSSRDKNNDNTSASETTTTTTTTRTTTTRPAEVQQPPLKSEPETKADEVPSDD